MPLIPSYGCDHPSLCSVLKKCRRHEFVSRSLCGRPEAPRRGRRSCRRPVLVGDNAGENLRRRRWGRGWDRPTKLSQDRGAQQPPDVRITGEASPYCPRVQQQVGRGRPGSDGPPRCAWTRPHRGPRPAGDAGASRASTASRTTSTRAALRGRDHRPRPAGDVGRERASTASATTHTRVAHTITA